MDVGGPGMVFPDAASLPTCSRRNRPLPSPGAVYRKGHQGLPLSRRLRALFPAARTELRVLPAAAGKTRAEFHGRSSSQIWIMGDFGGYPPGTCNCDATTWDMSDTDDSGSVTPPVLIDFHPGGKNFLYLDGHADNATCSFERSDMKKRTIIVVVVVLLVGVTAWGIWRHYHRDPKVEQVRQLQAALDPNLPPEQRRRKFRELRKERTHRQQSEESGEATRRMWRRGRDRRHRHLRVAFRGQEGSLSGSTDRRHGKVAGADGSGRPSSKAGRRKTAAARPAAETSPANEGWTGASRCSIPARPRTAHRCRFISRT